MKLTDDEKAKRNKKIQRTKRINKEEKRLRESFENISEDVMILADGLIKEASSMRIDIEDMKNDLDNKGWNELFSQSPNTPPYERERPTARQYISMNKSYQAIMKQLFDLLPKQDKKAVVVDDGFKQFKNAK